MKQRTSITNERKIARRPKGKAPTKSKSTLTLKKTELLWNSEPEFRLSLCAQFERVLAAGISYGYLARAVRSMARRKDFRGARFDPEPIQLQWIHNFLLGSERERGRFRPKTERVYDPGPDFGFILALTLEDISGSAVTPNLVNQALTRNSRGPKGRRERGTVAERSVEMILGNKAVINAIRQLVIGSDFGSRRDKKGRAEFIAIAALLLARRVYLETELLKPKDGSWADFVVDWHEDAGESCSDLALKMRDLETYRAAERMYLEGTPIRTK